MLYDQHLHSHHSFDCETAPADNVRAALERGLAGLTFTEHFDTHPTEWADCRYDDAAYSDAIASLREEFGDRIFIGKGIEVCYQPQRMDFILDHLAAYQFDLVILSIHWAGGHPIHVREVLEDWGPVEATRVYLNEVLEAVRLCRDLNERHGQRCFDVLGHLDFVKRYTLRFFNESHVDDFGDVIKEILRTCLEADLVPEVNTSLLRNNFPEPMPGPDTIRQYAALGGRAMSIGSDAHSASTVGADFDKASTMLRSAGIEQLAVFKGRQRELVSI